ncbi:phage baseplate protein [Candidatus Williamhamiltonella defendens]|uniref:phage baseplate protein n=1 Tax=Candidatus Williamhamiltonella defendens TaxID=138072 RepID=UPI0015828172|nr:phage tail protein [Candidatus Hamiltonella defensa]
MGIVAFFAQNKNPNTLFHGTTWQYIGENKTIRLAKADGSNVLTMGGSDSIKLTEAQIPVHAHTFSGKTSSFDYGTKQTNTTENHVHSVNTVGDEYKQVRSGDHFTVKTRAVPGNTSPSGSHYHTTYLGPHDHAVSGSTDNIGSGSAINITNAFVTLMGWYRTH